MTASVLDLEFGTVAITGPSTATVWLKEKYVRTCPRCLRQVMLLLLDEEGSRCVTCPKEKR